MIASPLVLLLTLGFACASQGAKDGRRPEMFSYSAPEEQLTGEKIFYAIEFLKSKDAQGNYRMTPSLIPGMEISLEDSFKSIVHALNEDQRKELIKKFRQGDGSNSTDLGHGHFKLKFSTKSNLASSAGRFYFEIVPPGPNEMACEGDDNDIGSFFDPSQKVEKVEIETLGNGDNGASPVPAMEIERELDQLDNVSEDDSWNTLPPGVTPENATRNRGPRAALQPGLDYIKFVRKVAKIQSIMLGVSPVDPFAVGTVANGSFFPIQIRSLNGLIFVPNVDSMGMIMGIVYLINF
ncbi:hypothetical protein PSACC_00312 [Paramicrosporidium saccamoebae]|uniref:Uncharacterized protein n=1 Tax=Paramicrosporidium saccamoebae TaxID=1246581 RepID=A0A2H9TQ61_9FUNG|nr:hypothetical protein PSACC_00312 [Paramicrosporidium saccamoebae]